MDKLSYTPSIRHQLGLRYNGDMHFLSTLRPQLTTLQTVSLQRAAEYISLLIFVLCTLTLLPLQIQTTGYILLGLGTLLLQVTSPKFRRHFILIYLCLFILSITPIGTTTKVPDAIPMAIGLSSVVFLPLVITRLIYREKSIRFPNFRDRHWNGRRWLYLLFIFVAAWLLIPFMLRDTGSYVNWQFPPGFWPGLEAYIGLNLVGIWDELFFVCTVLALLRQHFPFWTANFAQAVLFTGFLYTLAFIGWCVFVIYLFALLQGYIFKQTKSLLFILAIHLTVDLVLHLAIVYLHYPADFPFFFT